MLWRFGTSSVQHGKLGAEPRLLPGQCDQRVGQHSQGERFLLAETLYDLGRYEEAIPWYANIAQIAPYEVAHRSISYLRLGEIYDRQGDGDRAAEYYGKFIELWDDADPELQSHVEAARSALATLASDR